MMIVFTYDQLTDFLIALEHRAINKVFSQYLEAPITAQDIGTDSADHRLILQSLGYLPNLNTQVLVLHQCKLEIHGDLERKKVIQTLKEAFDKTGKISLVQGKIEEMFVSLS